MCGDKTQHHDDFPKHSNHRGGERQIQIPQTRHSFFFSPGRPTKHGTRPGVFGNFSLQPILLQQASSLKKHQTDGFGIFYRKWKCCRKVAEFDHLTSKRFCFVSSPFHADSDMHRVGVGSMWEGNVKMVLSSYSLNVSYSVKGNSSSPYQHVSIFISSPYMMSTEDVSWAAAKMGSLSISNRVQSGREFTVSISSKQRQQKLRWLEFRDMTCLFELCSTLKPHEFSSSYSTKDMNSPRQVMLPT